MKYYNITVNGVAYSVSVEETAAGAAPVAAAAPAAPAAPKAAPAPAALLRQLVDVGLHCLSHTVEVRGQQPHLVFPLHRCPFPVGTVSNMGGGCLKNAQRF